MAYYFALALRELGFNSLQVHQTRLSSETDITMVFGTIITGANPVGATNLLLWCNR